mmetsp:Transcript_32729/g.96471  ORF Transcript_32729/g.96471 Transcript_32729/m.96471 type:complete len:131 (+) Transcript_32729:1157-1549(+)
MVGEVVGAEVTGATVGEDDGLFVGILVILGADVDNAAGSDDVGVAGTKVAGGFVVLGAIGTVPVADGAGGAGVAVSCALTDPPATERTVAATSHIRLLRYTFALLRRAICSSERDVGSEDADILQQRNSI